MAQLQISKQLLFERNIYFYIIFDITPQIKVSDLQQLVLWVLANGENPNWVFVKNKPLIPKVVVLFVTSLGYDVYNSHKYPIHE